LILLHLNGGLPAGNGAAGLRILVCLRYSFYTKSKYVTESTSHLDLRLHSHPERRVMP
jgi:hypothetical protein